RVEPLRQAQHRGGAREPGGDLGERDARDGKYDDVRVRDRRLRDRRRGDALEVGGPEVARVAAGLVNRARLLGIAAGERHVVAAVQQDTGETRPPRAAAHDDDVHDRGTKAIVSGTPSSWKRPRS